MQELTQSRQELTQQIHANTELANQLKEERRRRSRMDYVSHSSIESSAPFEFNHRSTRRRLDGNYAEGSRHAVNLGQAGIGPSTWHQAGPSFRGAALSYHTIHDHPAAAAIGLEAEIQNQPDLAHRPHVRARDPYFLEDRELRRRGTDRRQRPDCPRNMEPDYALTMNIQTPDIQIMIRQMIRESQGLTNDDWGSLGVTLRSSMIFSM